MTDTEFARAFERGAVPNADFHHADHLRLAWVYLEEASSLDEAIAKMATALRRFATNAGKPEKYSDAVTEFFMRELAAARAAKPGAALCDVLQAFPRLLNKDAPTTGQRQD
jgi:5'-deoxynucleotidase YfbR-like HD superfamily hydrolase